MGEIMCTIWGDQGMDHQLRNHLKSQSVPCFWCLCLPLPSLSFPFSLSLLPSSLLSVHISVCSQELAGLCQTEIRWGCRSPLGGHMEEGQEGNNQAQSSLAIPPSRSFFLFLPSSRFLSLCLLCNQPARLHRSSGWLALGSGPSAQSPLLSSFTHCFPPNSSSSFFLMSPPPFPLLLPAPALSPGGRRWGHPVLSCPSARVFTCSVTGRHIWSAYSLVFTLFLPLTLCWPSIYPNAATRHIPAAHFRARCRRYGEPTSNFHKNHWKHTQAHINTHTDLFSSIFLFLSPLQWFFSCVTEIGVNCQQGWAEGVSRAVMEMGAKVSLLSSTSLSLYRYLFAHCPLFFFSFFRWVNTNYSSSSASFWKPMTTGLMKWHSFFIPCPCSLISHPHLPPCISSTHPPCLFSQHSCAGVWLWWLVISQECPALPPRPPDLAWSICSWFPTLHMYTHTHTLEMLGFKKCVHADGVHWAAYLPLACGHNKHSHSQIVPSLFFNCRKCAQSYFILCWCGKKRIIYSLW